MKWTYFIENQNFNLKELLASDTFSDVTLVSDDKKLFSAHKFVLAACSPIMKDLIIKNPHTHPVIYLRGIKSLELNAILHFLYLGQTRFHRSRTDDFFEAGRELKIEQLCNLLDRYINADQVDDRRIASDNVNSAIFAKDCTQISNPKDNKNEDDGKSFQCEECGARYISRPGLMQHMTNKHGLVSYSCHVCGFKSNDKTYLRRHRESIHEGVRYSCDNCSYKAKHAGHLKAHKDSIHKGIRYLCDSCGYRATKRGDLKRHKEAKHEGVRYPCDSCEYKATEMGSLMKHKKSIHEGIRYPCNCCEYKATNKSKLKSHIKTRHRENIDF